MAGSRPAGVHGTPLSQVLKYLGAIPRSAAKMAVNVSSSEAENSVPSEGNLVLPENSIGNPAQKEVYESRGPAWKGAEIDLTKLGFHEPRRGSLGDGIPGTPVRTKRTVKLGVFFAAACAALVFLLKLPRLASPLTSEYVFPVSLEPFLSALGTNQMQLDFEFQLKRRDAVLAWSHMKKRDRQTFFENRGLDNTAVNGFFSTLKILQKEQDWLEADARELIESSGGLPASERNVDPHARVLAERVARLVIRKEIAVAALSALLVHLRAAEDMEEVRAGRAFSDARKVLEQRTVEAKVEVKRAVEAAAALVGRDTRVLKEALSVWEPFPPDPFHGTTSETASNILHSALSLLLNSSSLPPSDKDIPQLDRSCVASVVYSTFQSVKSPREDALVQLLRLLDADQKGVRATTNVDLLISAEKAVQTTKAATSLVRRIGSRFQRKDCEGDIVKKDVLALLGFLFHLV